MKIQIFINFFCQKFYIYIYFMYTLQFNTFNYFFKHFSTLSFNDNYCSTCYVIYNFPINYFI